MRILTATALLTALMSSAALADECKDINFTLDTDSIRNLDLSAGAGQLNITGSDDDVIEVRGRACAETNRQLDDMDIEYRRRGDTWRVETDIPDADFSILRPLSLLGNSNNAYIDIEITVPSGLMLDIEDGSGDINIQDVTGTLRIDDGSGSITMRGITGNVDIEDGSGGIDLRNIDGTVDINDGSGSITLASTRDVRISDGSGSIDVRDVEGNVVVGDDGSGDIRIEGVSGSVTIEEDGSGSIDVRDVLGDFTTGDTGSGSLRYNNIGGRVDVDE